MYYVLPGPYCEDLGIVWMDPRTSTAYSPFACLPVRSTVCFAYSTGPITNNGKHQNFGAPSFSFYPTAISTKDGPAFVLVHQLSRPLRLTLCSHPSTLLQLTETLFFVFGVAIHDLLQHSLQ